MRQVRGAKDPQGMLASILQNNPNTAIIAGALNGGKDLETIARQMAQANNIDINQLVQRLQGGF